MEDRSHELPVELSGCLGLHGLHTGVVVVIIIIMFMMMTLLFMMMTMGVVMMILIFLMVISIMGLKFAAGLLTNSSKVKLKLN